jgi:hypothetical protein
MEKYANSTDYRYFGRRHIVWHAVAMVAGRAPEPCVVRNISASGALLEFPNAVPVAKGFRLVIDYIRFESWCDVRHQTQNSVGVYFPRDYVDVPDFDPSQTAAIVSKVRKTLVANRLIR